MGHPFKPFSLTGGSHTSVMDIKKVKINASILIQQRTVSMPSQYFDTASHKKSQCDFAFKAD
jgi:hypothetical protein